MFYRFGTNSTRVAQQQLPGLACVHCRTPGSLWASVLANYFYVGFIPAFPTGKTAVTECQHCRQVLRGVRQMPPAYQPPVQALLAAARTPLTHYSFSLLMLLVAASALLAPYFMTRSVRSAGPALPVRTDLPREVAGNRYRRSYGPGQGYLLLEVARVTNDSVFARITGGLRGPLTPASATVALRDSAGPVRGFYLGEWQQFINPEAGYEKL